MAIRALVVIGLEGEQGPFKPRGLAERFDCSPTYLSKILALLVRAGILTSIRGAHGGFQLGREPSRIRLLEAVEACQGLLTVGFCSRVDASAQVCAFHHAMREVHHHTVATLSRWTLEDLLARPACGGGGTVPPGLRCRMYFDGCEHHPATLKARS
jgi:Rrf2 family protein